MTKGLVSKCLGVLLLLNVLSSITLAASGNLFNVTSSGSSLPVTISFTLCLNAKGNSPLSCQTYSADKSVLSILTTIPNHTYSDVGIKINTPGYAYSTAAGANGFSLIGTVSNDQSVTGAIVSTTTVVVTPGGTGVSITPDAPQTLNKNSTQTFMVTANNSDYVVSQTVGGNCPIGSWSGDIYTTGVVTSDCNVSFSASLGTLYVGTGYGDVLLTSDNGVNWTTTNQPGGAPLQKGLSVFGTTMYLGGYNGNVELGTSGGNQWSHTQAQPDGSTVVATLAVSAQHLYAGTTSGNVAISYDGGVNWSLTHPAEGDEQIIGIATDGANPANIYVLSQEGPTEHVYHATEAGTQLSDWDDITSTIPTQCYDPNQSVFLGGLSFSQGLLYLGSASTSEFCSGSDIQEGIPHTWTSYSSNGPSEPYPYSGTGNFSILPAEASFPTFVAGSGGSYLYQSSGLNSDDIEWDLLCNMPSEDGSTIASSAVENDKAYFTTLFGYMAYCPLNGSTSPILTEQPGGSLIYGLSVQADGTLYVGGSSSLIQVSSTNGNSWQQPIPPISFSSNMGMISVTQNDGGVGVLAINNSTSDGSSKLYAYENSAWNPVSAVPTLNPPFSYRALYYDKNSDNVYLSKITSDLAPDQNNFVYKITNVRSGSPQIIDLGSPNGFPVYSLYYYAGLVYASTADGHIFTSPDDGSWTALPTDPEPGVAVNAIWVVNANIIYAGMASGHIALTENGGNSWSLLPNTGTAAVLSLSLKH